MRVCCKVCKLFGTDFRLSSAGGAGEPPYSSRTSYLSGRLLIDCQDATRHRTYSAVGDAIMGDGWAGGG